MSTALAYLAGVFDGEGCVGLYPRNRGKNHTINVTVVMSCKAIVGMFAEAFGGSVHARSVYVNKPMYTWSAASHKAVAMLEKVIPYLVEKLPQAELALEAFNYQQTTLNKMTPSKLARLVDYGNELKRLKRVAS